jgi:DNA polymerase
VAGSSSASKAWDLVPQRPTLARVREAAAGCRACELWKRATQTVFGEGSAGAEVMLVGEEPGDREDVAGHPFVGPKTLVCLGATAAQAILGPRSG